ncbi:MAG: sodium-translocating pyrophosphatase [Deltaproteobacteria bacterium]|nr:sodium-translocating pyrophosphatase [Deltaproteobacteria bacterium]
MRIGKRGFWSLFTSLAIILFLMTPMAFAGEADIKLPDLSQVSFMGGSLGGLTILNVGLVICLIGMIFGWMQYTQTKNLPAHQAMLDVSNTIWETCKTYLFQQGKFLAGLWVLIAICILYYFVGLQGTSFADVLVILFCSIMGILGSYGVAWFGIRINTVANSRAAFASLSGKPLNMVNICLRSGMSVGLLLVSIELFFMILILAYIPKDLAGPSFIGFAIGESLGASALRICGGIFTKIADIGSDLMKIIFHLPEDDPKNPGVIADCTGDNAGDSVGPTADGFETYGVTGVALISFLALALASNPAMGGKLIIWIFAMRILMILTALASYFVNDAASQSLFTGKKEFNFEHPLTNLVWITSGVSIAVTFVASYFLLGDLPVTGTGISAWLALSIIISCGTIAGALIPEFTKVFTSTSSRHCEEVVNASRQGGASLNILSGLVAGNFSAFWEGLTIMILMLIAYLVSTSASVTSLMPPAFLFAAPVFAFGLVAFGFLGMGPITIAVDSFGPVSDNAQSIYELSMIESRKDAKEIVKKHYGVETDFELAKHYLESADGAGNTFKATAKPVLIGTAVVGATTMVFGIIILLENLFKNVIAKLSLVQPEVILGLLMGGCVIYWFTGASMQAVVTGAYRAVVYIKEHIKLDKKEASIEDSKEVVKICTIYAQKGMINIFVVIFFMALALAFFDPHFFIGYLVGIAFFGLFQAIFMANAGGCWDNAKKIVEVDLKQKNTPLHEATVVGDTVGDPYKDTSSVSLNPVIKFTTLFGLLAVEIAVTMQNAGLKIGLSALFFLIALVFVYRSFYGMRISGEKL